MVAVFRFRPVVAGVGVFVIAILVELRQAINILDTLGIEPNRFTEVVFGSTFRWGDIAAYVLGVALAVAADFVVGQTVRPKTPRTSR